MSRATPPPPPPPPRPLSYQTPGTAAERFTQAQYVVRRQVFKLFGAAFHVYDTAGNVVLYSKQKAFKFKEDIRLYTDESMSTELLTIQARQVIDFGATYDVVDAPTRQKVGAFRRKGLKSMIRDEWAVLDPHDREVGTLMEDSTMLALVRRFVEAAAMFMPQKFHADLAGVGTVARFQQNFNPFVRKLTVDFSPDAGGRFDRRMGLAAGILLSAIEGRQQ
jgi:uncharacterized protein YxjI